MIYLYLAINNAICAAACVYLIQTDSPWWAGMFAIGLCMGTSAAVRRLEL